MAESTADQLLYDRIRAGDKSACDECISLHAPAVRRLALRLLGDEAEAEDLTQETFLAAFTHIDRFEWRSSLATWLYRIAHNLAAMRLRKKRPLFVALDAPAGEHDDGTTPHAFFDWCCLPEEDFASNEARVHLQQAIEAMPPKLRDVFVLRDIEELSTEETAAALDLTTANVKVRLHRARLWLREALSPYFDERQSPVTE